MQVILLERVPKLGLMGEVVSVRPGFARNFLIPRGKALRATKEALEAFQSRRAQLEAKNLEAKSEAEKVAKAVAGRSVVVLRQAGESGQLFGSVTARDIAAAFAAAGVTFDHHQVQLTAPLKALGIHDVVVALHPEVEVTLKVNVARSDEEADIQAGKAAPPSEAEEEIDEDDDLEAQIAAIR
jgi:large subunit ribosomal protein L9